MSGVQNASANRLITRGGDNTVFCAAGFFFALLELMPLSHVHLNSQLSAVNESNPTSDAQDQALVLRVQKGDKTAFDVLPLVIQREGEPASWFAIPEEKVLRVAISHPEYVWMEELGLQWYAVPVISDMRLEIGGISFPCAPFNGWYMLTEIAARNLGDAQRYNMLPVIAKKLNLDMRHAKTLWKDKAMLVLQEAVLHSFQAKGVTLVDHHTASEQFLEFCKQEAAKGRTVQADWAWIVPPASGSTLGVFHQEWDNQILSPNFHYQVAPWKQEESEHIPNFTAGKCPFSAN
jgi:nitric-oxide synthase